jgi:exodeoxyribonuclease VIII
MEKFELPHLDKYMPNDDYHARPELSSTHLKKIHTTSPLHYHHQFIDSDEPFKPSKAMIIGSAVHDKLLEPEAFYENFAEAFNPDDFDIDLPKTVQDHKDWLDERGIDHTGAKLKADYVALVAENGGKSLKQMKAEYAEKHAGKTLLSAADMADVVNTVDSIRAYPPAAYILKKTQLFEASMFWHDDNSGLDLRCRPDIVTHDGLVVDLKVTNDASPNGFQRSLARFAYHIQAAMYCDGVHKVLGWEPQAFVFIAAEPKPPYAVAVYFLHPGSIQQGWDDYRQAIQAYNDGMETDHWPGYADQAQIIHLPKWA